MFIDPKSESRLLTSQLQILESLGLPLSLVFLTGLGAGSTATLFLPVLGWASDKGSDPHKSKLFVIILSTAILVSGLSTFALANVLKIFNSQKLFQSLDFMRDSNKSQICTSVSLRIVDSTQSSPNGQVTEDGERMDSEGRIPWEGILGLLGIIMTDIGFDVTNSAVKAWTVASSEASQHTSLLLLGVLMASSGGMSSASLGTVDITGILGLSGTCV